MNMRSTIREVIWNEIRKLSLPTGWRRRLEYGPLLSIYIGESQQKHIVVHFEHDAVVIAGSLGKFTYYYADPALIDSIINHIEACFEHT